MPVSTTQSSPLGGHAACGGQHFADPGLGVLQYKSAGTRHLAKHRHLMAAHLSQHQTDLGVTDEAAVAQGLRNAGLRLHQGLAANFHRAN